MTINLEYYKIFYYVAKFKSITQAAEELFISQPAVSQAIKQLESLIGGSLFFRTSKGVRLTPEGEVLYKYVSSGYEHITLGESKFKELFTLETGEIRIGASDMTLQFYLLDYLEEFQKLYPKVKIKVTNVPTPEILEYLRSGKIDFGVVSEPVSQYKGLKIVPVFKIRDVFVANDRFSELNGKIIELRELQEYPVILLEDNTSTRKYVDAFLKENGTILNPEFELATSDLIVQFTKRSMGIGCVVRSFAEKLIQDGELFEIKLRTPIPERHICIVTQDKLPISPAGKKLLDLLMI
jgi:DNA-binding transcriptional LysR family regulator